LRWRASRAVSSSCSYASAAISRTLFKKGAAFIPSLAFLFASTNLVIELGIILYLLMGWQLTAAEPVLHELLSPSRVRSSKAARNAATASPSRTVPLSRSPSFQRAVPRLFSVIAQSSGTRWPLRTVQHPVSAIAGEELQAARFRRPDDPARRTRLVLARCGTSPWVAGDADGRPGRDLRA
jgi:hypothetical protein